MDVILLERIRHLGNLGDTVKVKRGFARNYLLPTGRAVTATADNIETFAKRRSELEQQAQERLDAAKKRGAQLENSKLALKVKARDDGKLFGSVGPAEIVTAMAEQLNKEIVKSEVKLPLGSIREVGEYEIEIHLHNGEVVIPVEISVLNG